MAGRFFFFQAEDGIRDYKVTGVQTCALPISFPFLGVFWSGSRPWRILRRRRLKRSEEHTSELQSPCNLVCRLLLEKKKNTLIYTKVEVSLEFGHCLSHVIHLISFTNLSLWII